MLGAWRARFCVPLALALIAAGCGGGSYTKSDFVARADAICAAALRETRSIAPPGTAQASSGQNAVLGSYLSGVVPVLKSEASQLRALRRPPGTKNETALLARYFAALHQMVAGYQQLAAAVKRGDGQTAASSEAALASNPVYSLASSYGLHSCGTPGATVA